jgi:hypothetical protein
MKVGESGESQIYNSSAIHTKMYVLQLQVTVMKTDW